MTATLTEQEKFRAFVIDLKNKNPTWTPARIATELESYEVKPVIPRTALRWKINSILKRGTIKDKTRSGAPRTVRTLRFQQTVKKLIKLKKGQSQRKVTAKLKQINIKTSRTTVQRAIKDLKLKPFKKRKAQKLTINNKIQRVACAKKLRKKFGVKKYKSNWKWNKIVNTDFSGIFTLSNFQNSKNDVIYAENADEINGELREAPREKYPKGVMFWGAISSRGLIPKNGPINFTKWLNNQKPSGHRGRMYMTGELYAKFLREKCVPAIEKVMGELNEVIFQDDQDTKQRTRVAMDTVDEFFDERIQPEDGDAKLADCWFIENVWGILKEKTRLKSFSNEASLVRCINQEWKKITANQCEEMMDKVPQRLWKIIQNKGDQIYEH
jgi:hypothetical protein